MFRKVNSTFEGFKANLDNFYNTRPATPSQPVTETSVPVRSHVLQDEQDIDALLAQADNLDDEYNEPNYTQTSEEMGVCLYSEHDYDFRRPQQIEYITLDHGVAVKSHAITPSAPVCKYGVVEGNVDFTQEWTPVHGGLETDGSYTKLSNGWLHIELCVISHTPSEVRLFGEKPMPEFLKLPNTIKFGVVNSDEDIEASYKDGIATFSNWSHLRIPFTLKTVHSMV